MEELEGMPTLYTGPFETGAVNVERECASGAVGLLVESGEVGAGWGT